LKNSIRRKVEQDSRVECPRAKVLPFPHENSLCIFVRISEWMEPHAI